MSFTNEPADQSSPYLRGNIAKFSSIQASMCLATNYTNSKKVRSALSPVINEYDIKKERVGDGVWSKLIRYLCHGLKGSLVKQID